MNRHLVKLLSTFLYLGYLPVMPGTFGSVAGVVLFYWLKDTLVGHLLCTLLLLILGFLVSPHAEKIFARIDAPFIVIDEVAGMLISFLFIPCSIKLLIIGFFLFRLLDTLKPFPADRIQSAAGGLGVMGDDVVAGLYANAVLQIVVRFSPLGSF